MDTDGVLGPELKSMHPACVPPLIQKEKENIKNHYCFFCYYKMILVTIRILF